ncbi:Ribosome quality control complex subunit [Paramyrothecium foliicola]|nr:Ribosome quality control complex subunit [Paramyrothecium foliicola]
MSTRQLRKLQRQREREDLDNAAKSDEENDSTEESTAAAAKPRVSLFAALGGDDGEAEELEEDEEEEQVQKDDVKTIETSQPTANTKSSKKKKKKKNKKTTQGGTVREPDLEDDDIDKVLKELNLSSEQRAVANNAGQKSADRTRELLNINTYHLKAMNEMRNMFGREAMESADAEDEQDHNRRRRGPVQQQVDLETFLRERPGAPKLPEVTLRRNIFIQGREHWPRQSAGGLTMKEIQKAPNGSWIEYAYSYEKQYEEVQTVFHVAVSSGDPMRLVHLLKQHPYHISTLLQVSNVAKQDQNMALAAELCERALFTFGRLATSSFRQNLEQGRARLDFSRPENREFWLAGSRYLQSLIRKGTYRTALEWAKVLFSLDPRDPYAVRFYIHSLAIKARESRWLIDFLTCLEESSDNYQALNYIHQSVVLAKLQLGDTEGAKEELTRGMQSLPWLYCALFQDLNLDTPPSIWGINADGDARSFWVKLYISKTKDLWNNTQATALLRSVAGALPRVEASGLPSDDLPADLSAARLAYLEGDTGLLALVPRPLLDRQPNYDSDPLPPDEGDNVFASEATRLPWLLARGHGGLDRMTLRQTRQGRLELVARGEGDGEGPVEDSDLDIDDDEELRRDIEEQAQLGNGPQLYGGFMQLLEMLGLTNNNNAGAEDDQGQRPEQAQSGGASPNAGETEALPGAWPEENHDANVTADRDLSAESRSRRNNDGDAEHRPVN